MSTRRKLFLVSIIAFLAIGPYAQEKDSVQTESKVNLKVVYEKTFDEPIVDVIFDTATVSIEEAKKMGWKEEAFTAEDKIQEKVLISYPKVVLISRGRELTWLPDERRNCYDTKELRFYDKNGMIINKIVLKEDGEHIHFSPNNKYILVSRVPTDWNPQSPGGTLYDLDGKKIWGIEGSTPIAVSDEGYAVAVYRDWDIPPSRKGDFYVYDSKGKLLKTIENPLKGKTTPEYTQFSKNGEYAIICFSGGICAPSVFLLITKEGETLWKKEFPKHYYSRWVGEIDILVDKGIAGCVENGGVWAFYFDWRGNLRWFTQLNTLGYACCKFAYDAEKVYVSSSTGYLWCFNKDNGSIIWMEKITDKGRAFTELYEKNQWIILKDDEYARCFFFDSKTGKLKGKIEYPGKKIFLFQHNGIIFVINATDNRIQALKIEGE